MESDFISYSFITTAIFSVSYVGMITIEVRTGNRILSNFRLYLDEKLLLLLQRIAWYIKKLFMWYERGTIAVESDIINPIAKPIHKTKNSYKTLKTGEIKLKRKPLSRISPYLRELIEKKRLE